MKRTILILGLLIFQQSQIMSEEAQFNPNLMKRVSAIWDDNGQASNFATMTGGLVVGINYSGKRLAWRSGKGGCDMRRFKVIRA